MASRPIREKANRPREQLKRLESDASARIVDLALILTREKTGERIIDVGGRWDTVDRRYLDEEPERCKVVSLPESAIEAAVAARDWIDARRHGRDRFAEIFLDGGRGSGKTVLGVLLVWAIDIAFPDARSFLTSPANTRRGELEIIVGDYVPASWRRAWVERDLSYTLPNGSSVAYIGADDEDTLKQGGFEVCLLNEAQLMTSQAYAFAAGGIRNVSGRPRGLLILARNPTLKIRGEWTEDHVEAIESGTVPAKYFKLDPRQNQFLEEGTVDDVDALIRSVRKDIADADVLGLRMRPGELALPAFKPIPREKGGHVGAVPHIGWRDVTREVTAKRRPEKRTGYAIVYGCDFQKKPGCVATRFKIWRRDDERTVYVAERHIVAGDNEDDLARLIDADLAGLGIPKREALLVCDGSGKWQNNERGTGKRSIEILSEWGFDAVPVVEPKDPRATSGAGRNPDVPDSLAQFYEVCEGGRFLVDPGEEWLIESCRRCKVKKRGGSLRLDDSKPGYSHGVDTCRYPIWYFEPVRGPAPLPIDAETMTRFRGIRLTRS